MLPKLGNGLEQKLGSDQNATDMPREIKVKPVLNKTKKRDTWFLDDYTFNPYSSCSFNCLYCYIRGSTYGTNLKTRLSIKTNAIEIFGQATGQPGKKRPICFIVPSSAADMYLQIEKTYELTRKALEVILKRRFPVHIITKSNLVSRDFDLLHKISKTAILPEDLRILKTGVIISFSFSTVLDEVGSIFEPGATPPSTKASHRIKDSR